MRRTPRSSPSPTGTTAAAPAAPPKPSLVEEGMRKLPALTVMYWVLKILSTTLGETFADMISMTLKVGYGMAALILACIFVACLIVQLSVRTYVPPVYWATITATSLVGTVISDFIDRTLQLGYPEGMGILLATLSFVFLVWRLTGLNMSVTKAMSRPSETFYWTTIVVSNTLGTALGDFTSDSIELGFVGGACLYGGLMLVTGLIAAFTKANRVVLFWVWFVLTRPFGATFGDVLTKDKEKGGVELGTEYASLIFAVPLLVLLAVHTTLHYFPVTVSSLCPRIASKLASTHNNSTPSIKAPKPSDSSLPPTAEPSRSPSGLEAAISPGARQ